MFKRKPTIWGVLFEKATVSAHTRTLGASSAHKGPGLKCRSVSLVHHVDDNVPQHVLGAQGITDEWPGRAPVLGMV